jgi:LPXTG-site transpeptidase (sortase) family protein
MNNRSRAIWRRPAVWLLWAASLLVGVAAASVLSGGGSQPSTDLASTPADDSGRQAEMATPSASDADSSSQTTATQTTARQANASSESDSSPSSGRASADGLAGGPATPRSELADLITELPPAPTGAPVIEPEGPRPVGLTINSLGVDRAPVVGVGIEDDGQMEVPPADEVGWYRYGPTPGEDGSAVLAAHIAYEGQDGVFVDLDDTEIGDEIEVRYDDGSTRLFTAVEVVQYDKNELPQDQVWGRSGDSSLVLITCGGDFNPELRSYEDNIVVYAVPA